MMSGRGTVDNGVQILIAEDSPTQAEQLKYLLEGRGYQVRVASTGTQALAVARTHHPAIVISDVMMPEMDGYTLCKTIKSDERLKAIPVILVTALSSPHDVIKGLECGADSFILKPYDEKYLLSRVNYVLANQELRQTETLKMGLEVQLAGRRYVISAERQQILDLLISTYEEAIRTNDELSRRRTELEALTRELREGKALLENVIAASPAVIFRVDPHDLTVHYVSANVTRLLGYAAVEVLGIPRFVRDRIHPEDRERVLAAIAKAAKGRQAQVEQECRFLHKNGTYRWLYNTTRFEYATRGVPLSAFSYNLDITDRREAEVALQNTRDEADRANQAKSEFLSRMSHELRTPLNAILGFGQLLEMDSLNPEQREGVEHILQAGRHLLDLINEVLDIARIEAGRLAISQEPVAVREVVQESLDLIAPLAAEVNVRLEGQTASIPDRFVLADRQRLKQVLLNFLSNAVKYNRRAGAVTLSYVETAEGRLRIEVNDTGPGIAPERMARLFTPFERLGAEQTVIEGTGLGLALSKGLVEAMGGTLGAESTVGRGSTFWVEFSLVEGPVERLGQTGAGIPGRAELDASKRAQIVLYIEDNLSTVKLIRRLTAHRPEVRLIPATQGRVGLDLAREHRPHLILLDLHLADIAGDEILRRLREDPETSQIPVVVISADATPGQVDRLLAAGAWKYLAKPLDVRKFLAILDEALKEREPGHAGRNA